MPYHRLAFLLAAVIVLAAAPSAAARSHDHRACARQFDKTVQQYIDTTHARGARGFGRLLHPRIVVVFRPGDVLYGKRDTMAFIRDFFADPNWTQTFRVVTTSVEGCKTAFVLFDSVYTETGQAPLPLTIGVSFTRHHGRWLAIHNQDSSGPPTPPNPPAS